MPTSCSEVPRCCGFVVGVFVAAAIGTIDVDLSLAGSDVKKVTPNWVQCQAAAEQQQGNADAAAAVAAAAVEALSEGLRDGSIQLDAHLMF
uniref:Uncharacterized protein n=1 Tax=Tetradesmus obliquus TaxID=3088 RepID=A0A383V3I2_TETOB|eukprot:jgi/Sobl393_1/4584/SZX59470.1